MVLSLMGRRTPKFGSDLEGVDLEACSPDFFHV